MICVDYRNSEWQNVWKERILDRKLKSSGQKGQKILCQASFEKNKVERRIKPQNLPVWKNEDTCLKELNYKGYPVNLRKHLSFNSISNYTGRVFGREDALNGDKEKRESMANSNHISPIQFVCAW